LDRNIQYLVKFLPRKSSTLHEEFCAFMIISDWNETYFRQPLSKNQSTHFKLFFFSIFVPPLKECRTKYYRKTGHIWKYYMVQFFY